MLKSVGFQKYNYHSPLRHLFFWGRKLINRRLAIYEECEAEGISDRTARRAMKRIGAVSFSKGGIPYWRLTN